MKRKLIFGLLVFTLVALLLFGACAEPEPATPAPTTPTAPAPPATQAPAPSEVIELNFATGLPPVATMPQLQKHWLEQVQEKSGGRLKINFYAGGSLLEVPEMFRGVQSGIADIGWYTVGEGPGLFELNQMALLPFMGWKSWLQACDIYYEITCADSKIPEFREEFESVGVIPYAARMMPPIQIMTTKKGVRVPEDIRGMKMYAIGDMVEVISQVDAAPVEMGPEEFYMSLERGLIEGVFLHFPVIQVLGLTELIKYNTIFGEAGVYSSPIVIIFNADSWNSLPPDIQKTFLDFEPWYIEEADRINADDIQASMSASRDLGQTFIELTPDEIQLWAELAQPVHEARIEKLEAMGIPGKELYEGLKQMIAEHPAR